MWIERQRSVISASKAASPLSANKRRFRFAPIPVIPRSRPGALKRTFVEPFGSSANLRQESSENVRLGCPTSSRRPALISQPSHAPVSWARNDLLFSRIAGELARTPPRVRQLNEAPIRNTGRYVLCWLQQALRRATIP